MILFWDFAQRKGIPSSFFFNFSRFLTFFHFFYDVNLDFFIFLSKFTFWKKVQIYFVKKWKNVKKREKFKKRTDVHRKKSSTKSVFSLFSMILYWSFAQKKKNSLFFFLQIFLSIAYTEKSKNLPTGWHFEPFLWNHLSLLIHI